MEMIRLNAPVRERDIQAILSFIPRLQEINPDHLVTESPGRLLGMDGDTAVVAMHGKYHPLVEDLQQALYKHRFIRDYDWPKWTPQAEAIFNDHKRLDRASMVTCIKLLTLHVRKDHFVDGHFANMLARGHISAILVRMQELNNRIQPNRKTKRKPAPMKFMSHVYQSNPSTSKRYAPRFADHHTIQDCLTSICKAWEEYLKQYVERTGELFGKSECPWESTEPAIVSTLSAAIMRKFPGAIVIGECRVTKPGHDTDPHAEKPTDSGFCDLWFSIPEAAPGNRIFSAYLEAKKSLRPKSFKKLEDHLAGKRGISKLFRDLMKSTPAMLKQTSAYRKMRKHEHYIIGMLVTPLSPGEGEADKVKPILQNIFERNHKLYLRTGETEIRSSTDRRQMARYPTVSLTVFDRDGKHSGMVASFTVLGSTRKLSASWAAKQKSGKD